MYICFGNDNSVNWKIFTCGHFSTRGEFGVWVMLIVDLDNKDFFSELFRR